MKTAEIRSKFLAYFEKNGHTKVESSSLIPSNDPTLLFTNAGMVQFKDVFTGKEKRPYKRATTSQKCVRAGGKHNDLENVGFTARHHTFFEMLGNFSFGDYFKKDAIRFAWEFVTKELKLPKDRLYVTVHLEDDEAAELWHKQEGIPKEKISRFDEDNFWAMGDTGPCGPCSEIFIDRGKQFGCQKPDCKVGCSCDRFMEIWNLVFMQFERTSDGKLNPLPKPSVDTGAGLERMAATLQNAETNYDIDSFREILERTSKLAGKKYDPSKKDDRNTVAFRVIADHSRATAFLIGDGVMPSNEGRGYVLRRIMRRAIRYGKQLGFTEPFLFQTTGFVIDQMADAYPELKDKRAFIEKAVRAEEEQFFKTLERGLALLDEEISALKKKKSRTLSGEVAFKLYDTFGFPMDLTRVICKEHDLSIDETAFEKSMEHQRSESRKHWKGSGDEAVDQIYLQLANELREKNKLPKFFGYESISHSSECVAILENSGTSLKKVPNSSQKEIFALFSETPFYGESGGQVGDRGRIRGNEFEGEVLDTQKPTSDLIVAKIRVIKGKLETGKRYDQETDAALRSLTAKNHTATHLLHWALREVLGKHVKQAGSLVNPELLRFDFAHFQALTAEELEKIETLINEKIWAGHAVSKNEMSKDAAVQAGAIAFFGEKYGDRVRVVKVGDYSTELCGGTHVNNSADIHFFKIMSESGIAAGVRRIVAGTSKGAFDYLKKGDVQLKDLREKVRASNNEEISIKLERLLATEKDLRKQIEKLQSATSAGESDQLLSRAKKLGSTLVIVELCPPDASGVKKLRELSEKLLQKEPSAVVVLGMEDPENKKAMLLAAKGPKAPEKIHSGKIIQDLSPFIEGRGGGKPEMAQAGGSLMAGLPEALKKAFEFLSHELG